MSEPGISLHAHLPLAWAAAHTFPQPLVTEWMHGNLVCLQALATLETAGHEGEREATGHDSPAARLEAKVDLALYLLGELIKGSRPLPTAVDVVLHAQSVEWSSATPPAPQTRGIVTLYLSPKLPWPLILPSQIVGVEGQHVRAHLLHMSEEAQEWLDRTLFRHHRRAVHAQTK